jgi:hypothetical protein
MQTLRSFSVLMGLALAGTMCAAPARASLDNQLTKFTFNTPVEIPGKVLPAGTYEFKLIDTQDTLDNVEILDAHGLHAIAIEQTVPVSPTNANGKAEVILQKTGPSKPEMVKQWFYGAGMDGHEFLYPNSGTPVSAS